MENITTVAQLKEAILLLKTVRARDEKVLIEQFNITYESLKPVNLIKDVFRETLPGAKSSLANTAIGISTGYIAKVVLTGAFQNPLVKVLGTLLQAGVGNFAANHPEAIKSGLTMLKNIFGKVKARN